jgi:LysM repeat protein
MQKFVYKVETGDTLQAIATQFNTVEEGILLDNLLSGNEQLYVGQRLLITVQKGTRYMVKPFESAEDIAKRFGITRAELLQKNGIKPSGDVFLGQVLYI